MAAKAPFKLAVLWSGDRAARSGATPHNSRYKQIFDELAALGIRAEPAVYADDMASEVREQLLGVDGVLVWVNPIFDGGNRAVLDALLRDVAARGIWVSAHPDVILKMGTKEILHKTRHLGWGTDTQLYRTVPEFRNAFPSALGSSGPRVLKQNRGNGGQGVWKVELQSSSNDRVRVLQATRGSVPEEVLLADFMKRCEAYLEGDGCIIDQPFQPRLSDGMIRCYMGTDKVVGFGHQLIKALVTPPADGPPPEPGPRIMHDATAPPFQALRTKMEMEWVPQMMKVLDLDRTSLPIIWDADFLYGPRTASGDDSYVLCEINVSCVFKFPTVLLQPLRASALRACPLAGPRASSHNAFMTDNTDFPDRLSINPKSPHYDEALLAKGIGIKFDGEEKTNVEEYCLSEGWIRVAVGKTVDRKGNPLTIKLKGKVEPYFQKKE